MPEMHLKQAGFTCSACSTKNKERIQKFMQTANTNYITNYNTKLIFNIIWLMGNTKI